MAYLVREGLIVYCVEPEGTWIYESLPAVVMSDKWSIVANGEDAATLTIECPVGTEEIEIIVNGEVQKVDVDSETGLANFQITTTSPGEILVRVGEKTVTKHNEVIIYAYAPN